MQFAGALIFDNSSSAVSSASRSFQILRRAKKIRVSRNLDGCRRCHSSSRKGCKTILKVEIGLELTNALLGHLSCSTPSTHICRAMQVKIDFISLFNCSDLLEWTDRVSEQVWAIQITEQWTLFGHPVERWRELEQLKMIIMHGRMLM